MIASRKVVRTTSMFTVWACVWLMAINLGPVLAQDAAEPPQHISINHISTEQLPQLAISAQALDASGNRIGDIAPEAWQVAIDGQPLSGTLALPNQRTPVAVAIVVDTSARMSDNNTPQRSRFRDQIDQVNNLISRLPPDSQVSLISFNSATSVSFALQADGGGVRNALNTLTLQAADAPQAPYDITNAIKAGLRELAGVNDKPRGLFLFAAGAPETDIDTVEIAAVLSTLADNPPTLTFISLGSDSEGTFERDPANPLSIARAAQSLAANYVEFFAEDFDQTSASIKQMHTMFDAFVSRSQWQVLQVQAGVLTPGDHTLQLAIGAATAEHSFSVGQVPPHVRLVAPSAPLTNTATFTVQIDYAQAPVTRVEYILNNVPIGASEQAPNFPFTFDLTDPFNQQQFPANSEYSLFAAATDAAQQTSRSAPVTIKLAPAPGQAAWLWRYSMPVAIGTALLVAGLIWLLLRKKRPSKTVVLAQSTTNSRKPQSVDPVFQATEEYSNIPQATAEYIYAALASQPAWQLRVFDGSTAQIYPVKERQVMIGKDSRHAIPVLNHWASHNHATLTISNNGVELTDLQSRNGTFVGIGSERRRLDPNVPMPINLDTVFWIGPEVKVELLEADQ